MTRAAQDGSAQEHLHAQAGGLPIVVQAGRTLELRQEIEKHQNAQEGRFGSEELLQAKVVCRQVGLQLLDALLNASTLIVVAPDLIGRVRPMGHEDSEGIAGKVEQFSLADSQSAPA